MAEPLALLHQRASKHWLVGLEQARLIELANQRLQTLQALQSTTDRPLIVFLAEPDPTNWLASFVATCAMPQHHLFLCNPRWSNQEWQQVYAIAQPDLVWGEGKMKVEGGGTVPMRSSRKAEDNCEKRELNHSNSECQNPKSKILIPTGGSSGQLRFAIHTWATLAASVNGFCAYFEVDRVHSCCILPFHHVSGLMQFLRSFLTGGQFAYPGSLNIPVLNFDPADFFLSLVPTQLQRLLSNPITCERLSQFHTVLLGGAPAWEDLLEQAKQQSIRLAPTYGMTETASQVATLKPEEFLKGRSGCGRVLPHAQIQIQNLAGESVNPIEVGLVTIQTDSLALGYYPDRFTSSWFHTDDLGYFDSEGILYIVGRKSQKIITGGENVFPQEVEAAIRATGLVQDVFVLGLPDPDWGEAVTAVYVPIAPLDPTVLTTALKPYLTAFKRPKRWVALDTLPRNAQGKVDRAQLNRLIC